MKIILSGATGFIGREVLKQALDHPSISEIICISRRALPSSTLDDLHGQGLTKDAQIPTNAKVRVIILSDFEKYPEDVLDQLQGAEACVWALGKPAHNHADLEACKKVEIEYTHSAAAAFVKALGPALKEQGKCFRFVYLSGKFANRDQERDLWFIKDQRNIKGVAENGLLKMQEENSSLELSIARPGGVLPADTSMPGFLIGATLSIRADELALAMLDEAVGGVPGTRTLENDELRARGKEVLSKKAA